MTEAAAELLLGRVDGNGGHVPQHVICSTDLVVRESA
jgi:DNA-binding LacI/PurR family transcriptional regulator